LGDGWQRPRNKDGLQAFLQAFPKLSCFRTSFSKENFGGFVAFQGVTSPPNHNLPLPNFFVGPAFFRPRSRRRRTTLRPLATFEDGERFALGQWTRSWRRGKRIC